MQTLTHRMRTALVHVSIAFVGATSQAQPVAPAAPPPPADDVVSLSEFTVRERADNSYLSAESTSGSRVAVKVTDLPYAVNTIPSELLKDFNVLDITEELAFASSVSGLDQGGNFNVRGFGGNIVLRNGFSRLGNFDRTAADRIEFIKGPAAAIYGQTNPGGIVNIMTKQPRSKPRQTVFLSAGSYDTTREEIEVTGPVPIGSGSKLSYLVNASYFHRTYESPNLATRTKSAYAVLKYDFSKNTSLSVDFDYSFQHNNVIGIPFTVIPGSPVRYTGLATELANKHYSSPTDWNEREVFNYEAFFEHRFSSVFSMRAGANAYKSPRYSYASILSTQYDPAVGQMINRTRRPNYSFLIGRGQSAAIDFVASYPVAKTTNKTLLTVDYYSNQGDRPTFQSASTTFGPTTLDVNNPVHTPYVPFNRTDYVVSRDRWDYARTLGTFLRHQIWMLEDRLIFMGGVRYDRVHNYAHDAFSTFPSTSPRAGQLPEDARWDGDNVSTTFGLNYKITPDIIFFASRSESFVPGGPGGLNLTQEPRVFSPNQTGLGYETGFKFDAFNHRLSMTTSFYDISLKNVQTQEVDPANPGGPLITQFEGGQDAKGFEIDMNWRVMDNLQWLFSYGWTDSRLTDRGSDLDIMSRQTQRIPFDQIGSALKYDINKAVNVYVSMRYVGWTYVDNAGGIRDTTPGSPTLGFTVTHDGRRTIKSPAYAVWNVGAAYKFKTGGALSHTINVTAKNVFDKFYVQPNRNLGDRFNVLVSYNIEH